MKLELYEGMTPEIVEELPKMDREIGVFKVEVDGVKYYAVVVEMADGKQLARLDPPERWGGRL